MDLTKIHEKNLQEAAAEIKEEVRKLGFQNDPQIKTLSIELENQVNNVKTLEEVSKSTGEDNFIEKNNQVNLAKDTIKKIEDRMVELKKEQLKEYQRDR
jgi:hypothetical protein